MIYKNRYCRSVRELCEGISVAFKKEDLDKKLLKEFIHWIKLEFSTMEKENKKLKEQVENLLEELGEESMAQDRIYELETELEDLQKYNERLKEKLNG